jgi:ketosteroid isomerase-like protein
MSQNVDFVLASYEWGNRERRFPRDFWHPDGEYVNSVDDPDHAIYRGYEAIEKLFASWMEAFPDGEAYPVDARGCDDDRVFVRVRMAGHGAESGIPFEMEVGHVVTLDDGKIRRLEVYFDPAEALEAAGLSE